jgi:dCTP deaminase
MGLLSDRGIIDRVGRKARDPDRLRISGFRPKLVKRVRRPSWGLSCYGYDMRLAGEFVYMDRAKLARSRRPYAEPGKALPWVSHTAAAYLIPPGGFVMARTMEYVRIPRDCGAVVFGKSTWARLAICLNTTLLEPEWEGTVTLEIANIGDFPVMLRAGVGICQVVFSTGDDAFPILTSYADRKTPTYQYQRAVTVCRV